MPNIYVYKVSVPENTTTSVYWVECEGFTAPDNFFTYDKSTAVKYFKGLAMYVEKAYEKLSKEDTNIINQLDGFKDLIYTTIYKLENLQ